MAQGAGASDVTTVPPIGELRYLRPEQLRRSPNNPRKLFDPEPMAELKENIRANGVLVPITVYHLKGSDKFAIIDGERRFRCVQELHGEGLVDLTLPANVVAPPSPTANLIYMFAIHNFRESWELMPTALSLQVIEDELGVEDDRALARLTGLSDKQIERCRVLLSFPEPFQQLSLEEDPKKRVPSNFWIELAPVLDLYQRELPDVVAEIGGRDGLTQRFLEKRRVGGLKSVIHLRRIMEAYNSAARRRAEVLTDMRRYIADPSLETRVVFDRFVVEARTVQSALTSAQAYLTAIRSPELRFVVDEREVVLRALAQVRDETIELLDHLEFSDAPDEADDEDEA